MAKELLFKLSYYRSWIFMIAGLNGFIFCVNDIIKTEIIDDYPQVSGIIRYTLRNPPFSVELDNGMWYQIHSKKMFQILKKKAINGKLAVIWYNEKNNIKQLIIEDEIVYTYSKSMWISIILMFFGFFLCVGNLIYLINFKKYKKNMKIKQINHDLA